MSNVLGNIVMEMTKWGVLGGIVFGAIHGVIVTLVFLMSVRSDEPSILEFFLLILLVAIPCGVIFGGVFGLIAGALLGILNGFIAGILTEVVFFPLVDIQQYRLKIGIVCAITTLIPSMLLFHSIFLSPSFSDYVWLGFIPAHIAALVLAYASQRAARWYQIALNTVE